MKKSLAPLINRQNKVTVRHCFIPATAGYQRKCRKQTPGTVTWQVTCCLPCQCPSWRPVQALVAPLPIQLLTNAIGKAAAVVPSALDLGPVWESQIKLLVLVWLCPDQCIWGLTEKMEDLSLKHGLLNKYNTYIYF